jgi:putative membrane protein
MWGFGFLWPLLWLLVIAVVVIGAMYLFTNKSGPGKSDQSMELLREQYARGEIGDEEFDGWSSKLTSSKTSNG